MNHSPSWRPVSQSSASCAYFVPSCGWATTHLSLSMRPEYPDHEENRTAAHYQGCEEDDVHWRLSFLNGLVGTTFEQYLCQTSFKRVPKRGERKKPLNGQSFHWPPRICPEGLPIPEPGLSASNRIERDMRLYAFGCVRGMRWPVPGTMLPPPKTTGLERQGVDIHRDRRYCPRIVRLRIPT